MEGNGIEDGYVIMRNSMIQELLDMKCGGCGSRNFVSWTESAVALVTIFFVKCRLCGRKELINTRPRTSEEFRQVDKLITDYAFKSNGGQELVGDLFKMKTKEELVKEMDEEISIKEEIQEIKEEIDIKEEKLEIDLMKTSDELEVPETIETSVGLVENVDLLNRHNHGNPVGRFHTRQLVAATGCCYWLPRVKGPGNCKQLVSTTNSRHSLSRLSVERMASNEELLLFALLARKKRRIQKRRMHVHQILSSRMDRGLHHTLYNDLRADEMKFFNYFRMTKPSFEELLSFIRRDITGIDTNMRRSIKPEEKLAVTLRYLGSGATMTDLHYQYRLGISTISNIIRQVCKAIWEQVKPVCFPEVTERFWLETAAQFYQRTNFPHCLGALDGKHIRVIKPENTGSLCYTYKNYFSILLLALCDASYKFVFIDVGAYGKSSDSTVFKESVFFRKLENQTLNIPPPQESYTGFETPMPFVFVADEVFGLSQYILRPYAGKFLSEKKRIFNYRLSRARRHIECSFGILANKWRIFHRPLNVDLALAEDIVKVCCVLHNFVRERDGVQIEDTLMVEGLFEMEPAAGPTSRLASNLRDKFADYFVSDKGAVPWQLDRI